MPDLRFHNIQSRMVKVHGTQGARAFTRAKETLMTTLCRGDTETRNELLTWAFPRKWRKGSLLRKSYILPCDPRVGQQLKGAGGAAGGDSAVPDFGRLKPHRAL